MSCDLHHQIHLQYFPYSNSGHSENKKNDFLHMAMRFMFLLDVFFYKYANGHANKFCLKYIVVSFPRHILCALYPFFLDYIVLIVSSKQNTSTSELKNLVFGLIQSPKTYWWIKEKKDLLFYFILLIINLQTVFSFLFDNLLKIVIRLKLKIDGFLWK